MTDRRSIWEWAVGYVGDPVSWQRRGEIIRDLLIENGMRHDSDVLEIGCGNLSQGLALITYLDNGRYVGVDPSGWLVEAALQQWPDLEAHEPEFLWRSDFDTSELGRKFTHIVSHSVLSHAAWWQLDQMLAATRKVVDEGAVMLASFRNDQYGSWSETFQYPGNTTFRLPTVIAAGRVFGWHVEIVPEYRERLSAECSNDVHDWLRLTAVESSADRNDRRRKQEEAENDFRLEEEEVAKAEQDALADSEAGRVAALVDADADRIRAAGLVP